MTATDDIFDVCSDIAIMLETLSRLGFKTSELKPLSDVLNNLVKLCNAQSDCSEDVFENDARTLILESRSTIETYGTIKSAYNYLRDALVQIEESGTVVDEELMPIIQALNELRLLPVDRSCTCYEDYLRKVTDITHLVSPTIKDLNYKLNNLPPPYSLT